MKIKYTFWIISSLIIASIIACSPKSEKVSITLEVSTSEITDSITFALGEQLFYNNCATCHDRYMRVDLTAPNLAGVEERWKDYPREDLYNFIRDSQKMISEQHPQAVEVWRSSLELVMMPFPDMEDDKIEAILYYIREITRRNQK